MLSHTLGTFLPAVIPADLLLFRVPLPFALSPQASSSESPRLSCSCCPCPQAPRGAHFPDTGRHPPEVCLLGPEEASSANSMWPEKLFLPFGNLLTGVGSDQLPGKEFSRTSSQREKKRKHTFRLLVGRGKEVSILKYTRALFFFFFFFVLLLARPVL